MAITTSLSKQQINDIHKGQHNDIFKKIDIFLNDLNTKLKKQVQIIETNKLEQYKDDLIKTKTQFQQLKQKRCDNAIKKAVHSHKKSIQKQCANFLEKSQEVNKIYEGLKQKLINMSSTQQQLKHQIQYLHKQIKIAKLKNQNLNKQLKCMEQQSIKNKQQKNVKLPFMPTLLQKNTNMLNIMKTKPTKNEKQLQKIQTRTQKWKQNSQQRLKDKIQYTKQFLNSIVFEQSTLQKIFQIYDPQQYNQEKKKLTLIQTLFSQPHIKQQLYYLLFENSRK